VVVSYGVLRGSTQVQAYSLLTPQGLGEKKRKGDEK